MEVDEQNDIDKVPIALLMASVGSNVARPAQRSTHNGSSLAWRLQQQQRLQQQRDQPRDGAKDHGSTAMILPSSACEVPLVRRCRQSQAPRRTRFAHALGSRAACPRIDFEPVAGEEPPAPERMHPRRDGFPHTASLSCSAGLSDAAAQLLLNPLTDAREPLPPRPPPRARVPGSVGMPHSARISVSRLPFEVLLICFGFADFVTLCRACVVCRRWNSISNSTFLWRGVAHALHLQLPDLQGASDISSVEANPAAPTTLSPKAAVRDYITRLRQHLAQNMSLAEEELTRVQERLQQRLNEAPPFAAATLREAGEEQPRLREVVHRAESALSQLSARLQSFEQSRSHVTAVLDTCRTQLTSMQSTSADTGDGCSSLSGDSSTLARTILFEQFERRVCRVVLRPLAGQLPVVLCRGTNTFAAMELLCLQLSESESAGQSLRARWRAFQRFFPLTDEYFAASKSFVVHVSGPCGGPSCASGGQVRRRLPKAVGADSTLAYAGPNAAASLAAVARRLLTVENDASLESMMGLP